MTLTLVSFHAHPDDETLLTGGTLARASAEGHRVVLVMATDGGRGLTAAATLRGGDDLASIRRGELQRAAASLGVAAVRDLGYGDSGYGSRDAVDGGASRGRAVPPGRAGTREPFAAVDPEQAARRLADILRDEGADALTIYDSAGGYGHRDHLRVHAVGMRAAALAGTPLVLQATVDRDRLRWALRIARWVPRIPAAFRTDLAQSFADPRTVTHRVDVGAFAAAKRAAMAAHASQATADAESRTLGFCLALPRWLFRRVFRYEWFIEVGRQPTRPPIDDIFASLR